MKPIIFDTDPGIDDAIALLAAMAAPELDILAITSVCGNVNIDLTTQNARNLVGFMHADIPVARGAEKPLLRPYEDASYAHGETGMGGYTFHNDPAPLSKKNALTIMKDVVEAAEEPVTLACLGPLTNVALFLHSYPNLKAKIKEVISMGGVYGALGNTHSLGEYNYFGDPHAVKMVFASGVPVTMIGLNVTHTTKLLKDDLYELKEAGEVGQLVHGSLSHYTGGNLDQGYHMHDACVTLYALKPELFTTEALALDVVTDGVAQGAVVSDFLSEQEPNVNVAMAADVAAFREELVKRLFQAEDWRKSQAKEESVCGK